MKPIKEYFLIAAAISYITVIGGAVYEHLCVVPRWSMAPPESLYMFQGKYGVNPGAFWMPIHPLTLLLMIITLYLCWNSTRKKFVLYPLLGYVAILLATFIYFVPELMAITKTPFEQSINAALQSRASLWEKLSIIRLVVLIVLAVILLSGLNKNDAPISELKTA